MYKISPLEFTFSMYEIKPKNIFMLRTLEYFLFWGDVVFTYGI